MAQRESPRIVRLVGDFTYSGIATRRMFGGSADVRAMDSLDACLGEVLARRADVAVVPVYNAANKKISCADSVPVMDRAEAMGLRTLAALGLPVDHVLASFGSIEGIAVVYSKDEALVQCSRIIERHGWMRRSVVPVDSIPLSTAGAARHVAGGRSRPIAAICSGEAAEHQGVPIVQRNIADSPDSSTAFHAYVRAGSEIPAPEPRGP